MWHGSRREFLRTAGVFGGAMCAASATWSRLSAGEQTENASVEILNPRSSRSAVVHH